MNFISKLQSKPLIKKSLFLSIIILFGIVFFSFPCFSFLPSLFILTWVLTFLYIGLVGIYLILYKKIQIDMISLSFIGFIVCVLIGSAFSGFKGFVITPIALSLVGFASYLLFSVEKRFCKFLFFSSYLGILLFSFVFIIRYRQNFLTLSWVRLGNTFGDINDISLFFGLGTLISFYYLFFIKKIWIKIVTFIAFLIFFICGMSTGSKIYLFITVLAVIGVIILFFRKKWWISLLLIASLSLIFLLLLNIPIFSTMKSRFLTMFSTLSGKNINGVSSNDMSTIGRVQMFEDGIQLFLRRPLFGFGANGFFTFSSYGGGWSHNHFSETLCSFGLVGSVFYHAGFFFCFKSLKNKKDNFLSFLILCSFIVMMFSVALNSQKLYSYLVPIVFADMCELKPILTIGRRNENEIN